MDFENYKPLISGEHLVAPEGFSKLLVSKKPLIEESTVALTCFIVRFLRGPQKERRHGRLVDFS